MPSFWSRFRAASQHLHAWVLAGRLDDVLTEIEGLLAESGFDYAFDIAELDGKSAFILSPEGDEEVAAEIDRLLAGAGETPNWLLYGRRQQKAPEDAIAVCEAIYGLELGEARFTVDGPSVTLYTNAHAELDDEDEAAGWS